MAVYYYVMARTVDPHSQAVKRNEILDAAIELVSTKGYEAMAIQELLVRLGTSKGALYHYFPSKSALLEGLIDRVLIEAEQALSPVVSGTSVAAPEALSRFFVALGRDKAGPRPFIIAVLPVWYSDDNAIMRDKVRIGFAERLAPMLSSIIQRGCEEGTFAVSSPDQTARIVLGLTQDLADALARLLLRADVASTVAVQMERMVTAATEAIERVLRAAPASIRLVESGGLDAWLQRSGETSP